MYTKGDLVETGWVSVHGLKDGGNKEIDVAHGACTSSYDFNYFWGADVHCDCSGQQYCIKYPKVPKRTDLTW